MGALWGMRFVRGAVLAGLCACNVLLDNSTAEILVTDGGGASSGGTSSGALPDAGGPPLLDGGTSSSSGGVADAGSVACPCGEGPEGTCAACAPVDVAASIPGITHLAVTTTELHYLTALGMGHVPVANGTLSGDLPTPPGDSDAPLTIASGVPAWGASTLATYFTQRGAMLARTPDNQVYDDGVQRLFSAKDGVVLVANGLRYATESTAAELALPQGIEATTALIAANETHVYASINGALSSTTLWRISYGSGPSTATSRSVVVVGAKTMLASAESVIFAPCTTSAICSVPTSVDGSQVESLLPPAASRGAIELTLVDGAILYFAETVGARPPVLMRCNMVDCGGTLKEVASGKLQATTRDATHLYFAFQDRVRTVQRSPLRPSR